MLDPEDDFDVSPFRVVTDTREQAPFQFRTLKSKSGKPLVVPTERKTLPSGDYSVAGLEHLVAIERKSHQDLYGTLTGGRDRFIRELERLTEMVADAEKRGERGYAAVVVEAGWGKIATQAPPLSKVRPESIAGTINAFAQRYRVQWWFYPTRHWAEDQTYRLLERFFLDREKEKQC